MIVDESIKLCEQALARIKNTTPEYDQNQAIVAAPEWFVQKVKQMHGVAGQDVEIDTFCGCMFVRDDKIPGPVIIAADGRTWQLTPKWMRPAADSKAS